MNKLNIISGIIWCVGSILWFITDNIPIGAMYVAVGSLWIILGYNEENSTETTSSMPVGVSGSVFCVQRDDEK